MMLVNSKSVERLPVANLGLIGNLAMPDFLKLAIQITNVVNQVHQQQLVYKHINPYNIIVDRDANQIYFIGFNDLLPRPQGPDRELAYISPEQTGRINRPVDYRTDFYSLGVTLYELLTGRLPFLSDDPGELVHSHIAHLPLPPHELRPDTPHVISHITLKLLSKSAGERYQSAYGLAADLGECLQQWQSAGRIDPFLLGSQDFRVNNSLQISRKLYGRESETEMLRSAFQRVQRGDSEMVFVSGYTGVGKSALVQNVFKSISKEQGYFVAGKFDQYQFNVPYISLIQALKSLIRQILTENEEQLAIWKKELLASLGPNARIIIDAIPDVELIVGPQPEVAELSPPKTLNRFNFVFQNFIRVFTRHDRLLVIFLDDLQWADTSSLDLLQSLLETIDKNLLVIGAYRDNEVISGHPLKKRMDVLGQNQKPFIHLAPLRLGAVNQFLADTFNCSQCLTEPLASVVLAKSGGNPLFAKEFLKSLYSEKLVRFNPHEGWQWDLATIQGQDITDDIAKFLVARVQQLEEGTQQVLNLAACVGGEFDLQTLTAINGQGLHLTTAALQESIEKGLVFVSGAKPDSYSFAHDQIQQACYLLSSGEQRRRSHYQIGRLLLPITPVDKQQIFDIVHHLNQSVKLASSDEIVELAQLNLMAGQRAKSAVAYASAFEYLQKGMELTGYPQDDNWHEYYPLKLLLHQEAAEAAYLCGDFVTMENLTELVLRQARTPLDKVKAYEIKIQAYQAQHQPLKAIEAALDFLTELGVRLPRRPSRFQIVLALARVKIALLGKKADDLGQLPPMTDPNARAAMRIMAHALIPTYVTMPTLLPLLLTRMIGLSLKYGNAAESAVAYNGFGLILCGVIGDIKTGHQFSQFAQRLIKVYGAKEYEVMIKVHFNGLIRHWRDHRRETMAPLQEGYKEGLETGDLVYASYGLYLGHFTAFVTGCCDLNELDSQAAIVDDAIAKMKQEMVLYYHRLQWQGILNLMGRSEDPCSLVGEFYDERCALATYYEADDFTGISAVHSQKMMLLYLFRRYDEAAECAIVAGRYIESVMGAPEFSRFYLYDSLVWLAVARDASRRKKKRVLGKVAKNQKKIKKWAVYAPHNYAPVFHLIEAEWARMLSKDSQAKEHFDQAISLAGQYGNMNVEAVAYELGGGFYYERGLTGLARTYLQASCQVYRNWGATAKVEDLETQYPQFFSQTAPDFATSPSDEIEGEIIKDLDLTSITKASRALAAEQALDELISTLMKIVIENAGAQKGYLLFRQKKAWAAVAAGAVGPTGVGVTYPVSETYKLPASVINYAIRTKKTVVLPDKMLTNLFSNDAYFTTHAPLSVLCTPLLNQNRLSGVLYLENHLVEASFTKDRVDILKFISAQAATALEHTRRYSAGSDSREIEINVEAEFTAGEKRVFEMVIRGWTNKQISEKLFLSDKTVRNRLSGIYQKLGVDNRTGAVFYAINKGWIQARNGK